MTRPKRTKQCRTCGETFTTTAGFADCNPCRYRATGKQRTCTECGTSVTNRSTSNLCSSCWSKVNSMENASAWKGGRTIHKPSGYVLVKDPDHPNARADGYVREHVKVASEKIGRPLYQHEDVHHINGDKQDNRPENLMVLSKQEHTRLHQHQRNGNRPLTPAEIAEVQSIAAENGYPPGRQGTNGPSWAKGLAHRYGCSVQTIYRHARGSR